MISEQTLSEATERLASGFHPMRIILLGSQARGDADGRSDVDLLVVCPLRDDRRRLMVAMDRSLKGLGFARDIIVLTPEEYERDRLIPGTIAWPASREGVVLYETGSP